MFGAALSPEGPPISRPSPTLLSACLNRTFSQHAEVRPFSLTKPRIFDTPLYVAQEVKLTRCSASDQTLENQNDEELNSLHGKIRQLRSVRPARLQCMVCHSHS